MYTNRIQRKSLLLFYFYIQFTPLIEFMEHDGDQYSIQVETPCIENTTMEYDEASIVTSAFDTLEDHLSRVSITNLYFKTGGYIFLFHEIVSNKKYSNINKLEDTYKD